MARLSLGSFRVGGVPAWWAVALSLLVVPAGPVRADRGSVPGGLSGVVLDPLGRAIPGVEIRLAPLGDIALPVISTRSDRDGRFLLRDLSPGIYRLVAIKGGYAVLVDRVDTLLRRTLELVLHPAATGEDPRRAAPDRSWVLRLPRRDVLEDLGAAPGFSRGEAGFSPRVTVDLAPSSLDCGTGGEGHGVDLGLRTGLVTRPGGWLSVALVHRGNRGRDGLLEQVDRAVVSGTRAREERGLAANGWVAALRRRAARRQVSAPASRVDLRGWTAGGRVAGRGREGSWGWAGFFRARSLEGKQPGLSSSGRWVSLGSEVHGRVAGEGTLVARGILADPAGAFASTESGSERLLSALAPSSGVFLDGLRGTSLDLDAEMTWEVRDDTRIGVAFRGVTVESGGTRWSGWTSLDWTLPGGWGLRAAGGLAAGAADASRAGFRVGLGRESAGWSWAVRRFRSAGPVPGDGPGIASVPFLLVERSAWIDTWEGRVTGRLGRAGAAVHLGGRSGIARGALAPRLPGDLPLVPVGESGRARFLSFSGAVSLGGGHTRVGVRWRRLRDLSAERSLLAGGEHWTDREVELVQRLGSFAGWGASCEILVQVGRSRVRESAATDGARERRAFLRRDRLAGGLRVAF